MSWQRWTSELARKGLRSLAGPERGERQRLEIERLQFEEATGAGIQRRAASLAGFLTPMIFYLAGGDPRPPRRAAAPRRGAGELRGAAAGEPASQRGRGGDLPHPRVPALVPGGLGRRRRFRGPARVPQGAAPARDPLRDGGGWGRGDGLRAQRPEPPLRKPGAAELRRGAQLLLLRLHGRVLPGPRILLWSAAGGRLRCALGARFARERPGAVASRRRLGCTHVRQRGVFRDGELAVFQEQLQRDLQG